ncbi:hypothetical protein WISP_99500 [Willisornis vidua]|uniref:Cytoskeleton-associated protein 2 C-terminal domain-containing protein n=1 Tax=Willisornis vidua TaxID=1566151 RepID=A0ABQ9CZ20_9PASS|nr:hypothetical protein WISP_99500 [Willisornis vidua]
MAEVEMAGKDMGMLLSSEQLKPEQLRTSVLSSLRVPRTPSAADRRVSMERSFLLLSPAVGVTVCEDLLRGKEVLEGPELKYLTPVRRSLRVERAGSCYPEMLRDHDPVVSSLSEILDAEKETQFFFRRNKALPEVTELKGLSSYPTGSC